MKKNDIVKINITDITAEGSGVGRYEGMAVFVPSAAVGDEIECRIVKVLRSYCYGIIERIITPSADRLDRGCEIKNSCGGCIFRHISYEAEKRIKADMVKNAFVRLGGFDESTLDILPITGCTDTDRYRNKAQYPVSADKQGHITAGFYARRSHRIIPCEDCLLQPEIFGDIVKEIIMNAEEKNIPPYDEVSGKGALRHIYLRKGYHSGEVMVCLVTAADDKMITGKYREIAHIITRKFSQIRSVILNINKEKNNVILGKKCITLWGSDTISDTMCGVRVKLSPLSFYQVNTAQAEELYRVAGEFAALTGREDVLDLYCGAGTIGLSLAGHAGRVTGAEIIPEAVENARENARESGIVNADFICADAGQAAKRFLDEGRCPDVIITDPPRKGCDVLTLESMVKMSPGRIVMVSCNPATAARDCRFLAEHGYVTDKIKPVDMFAGTGHVECVVLMSRVKD